MDVQARIVQVIFPSRGVQIATYLINVLGIVTSTHFSSRRLASFEKLSRSTIRQTAWSRLFVLLVFVVSWCFFVSTGILLFGVGLRQNSPACTAGFYACLLPYCAFKLAVYAFLIKRVLVVWNHRIKRGRPLRITIYLLCIGTAALYVVMIAVTIIGRITFLRVGDGECFLGLKGYSSFVVFGSDLIVSIVLTSMFLWPIMGAHLSNGPLKRLARRTLIAGIVALATSSANALAMALIKKHEQGWLCILCCSADIICNATAVFWLTTRSNQDDMSDHYTVGLEDDHRESKFTSESGRLAFRIPAVNIFSRNSRKNGLELERVAPRLSHGHVSNLSVDLVRTGSHGGVKPLQVTITTQIDREECSKEDCVSNGVLQQGG